MVRPVLVDELVCIEVEDAQIFYLCLCVVWILSEASHEIKVVEEDRLGDTTEVLRAFGVCDMGGCQTLDVFGKWWDYGLSLRLISRRRECSFSNMPTPYCSPNAV